MGTRSGVETWSKVTLLSGLAALGCGGEPTPAPPPAEAPPLAPATYHDDIEPLFAKSCAACHRADGIGPFALDDYAGVRAHAGEILRATEDRTMPPWPATADGSCGTFADDIALTERELERIRSFFDDGMLEGSAPEEAPATAPASLAGAVEFATPVFEPTALGTDLAEADEYRCFSFDLGIAGTAFVTGFEVLPGTPSLVHHVLGMLVDPDASAASGAGTNAERIAALRATSPEREGWPCFGMAGEGVGVDGFPIVWGPGQPAIEYPRGSGLPVTSKQELVLQVHYNLAHATPGVSDQTRFRLRFAASVPRLGGFIVVDPLLQSLDTGAPELLPAGRESVKVSWSKLVAELGLPPLPGLELSGVMPHMHERARRYGFELGRGPSMQCAAEIPRWDMHWQRLYFYEHPYPIALDTRLSATCDYDTSHDTEPVSPGWGISNEMCATILYFTAPNPGAR